MYIDVGEQLPQQLLACSRRAFPDRFRTSAPYVYFGRCIIRGVHIRMHNIPSKMRHRSQRNVHTIAVCNVHVYICWGLRRRDARHILYECMHESVSTWVFLEYAGSRAACRNAESAIVCTCATGAALERKFA